MAEDRDDIYQALEAPIATWNHQAESGMAALQEALDLLEAHLETLRNLSQSRPTVAPSLVQARLKMRALQQSAEERQATVAVTCSQIEALSMELSPLQEALATLTHHAATTEVLTQRLYQRLESIQGKNFRIQQEPGPPIDAYTDNPEGKDVQPITYRMPEHPSAMRKHREELAKTSQELFSALERRQSPYERMKKLAEDTQGKRLPLGMLLVHARIISERELENALQKQQTVWNRHLGQILIEMGLADAPLIAQAIAAQSRLPYVDLSDVTISPEAVALIPPHLAQLHRCIPFRTDSGSVDVAMANPLDLIALEDLEITTGLLVRPHVATEAAIQEALPQYYAPRI